jgi:hypothetical protein
MIASAGLTERRPRPGRRLRVCPAQDPGPATGTAGVTGTDSESRVHGTPVGNFNFDPEPKQLLILRVHPLLP